MARLLEKLKWGRKDVVAIAALDEHDQPHVIGSLQDAIKFLQTYEDSSTGLPGNVKGTGGAAHVFASATSGGAVTPSDATVLAFKALWVGGAGDVSVDFTEGGTAVVFVGVPAGTMLAVTGTRVNAATTATNITWINW